MEKSKQPTTIGLLHKVWKKIDRRRRLQLLLLVLVMLGSGIAEIASLGAIIPFLAVLSDPNKLLENESINILTNILNIDNNKELTVAITIVFAVTVTIAAIIRLLNIWLNGRLAALIGSDLSCEAYRRTLFQPYETHIQRNSSRIITSVTNQVNATVAAINSALQLMTGAIVAGSIVITLSIISFSTAFIGLGLFSSIYIALAYTARIKLESNGKKVTIAAEKQIKSLQEGLGGIRDIIINNTQSYYLSEYKKTDITQRNLKAQNMFISAFPRYSIEACALVVIAGSACTISLKEDNFLTILPWLGVITLAAQRLLPAAQQIYGSWAVLKTTSADLQGIIELLEQKYSTPVTIKSSKEKFKCITFKNVYFAYNSNLRNTIENISFQINAGEKIGLIGTTGGGKSTIADLMMGLLKPTSGSILVNNRNLNNENNNQIMNEWRSSLAHVPQSIFLADASILENIAFGIPKKHINIENAIEACKQAQIYSLIMSMENGFKTQIGERGIKLSGGQRQRLGLARALYRNSKFIILDEATSALDTKTESLVMKSISELSENISIVIIAHRLTTLSNCDKIFKISNGKLIQEGPPSQILN